MRAFHIRRDARERYGVDRALLGVRGDLVVGDLAGIRRLADRMNRLRPAGPSIQAGDIGALGLLHEIGHLLVARYEADHRPGAIAEEIGRAHV